VPINRETTLKQAEKLLRQGKLAGAITEYIRLVEDYPNDWNSMNVLGDLYARSGAPDSAAAQFTRVADHFLAQGFLPKAAALYKKALKIKGDHEHSLSQLAEIAAQQELLADATAYLRQLADQRQKRGDAAGAAGCLVRLGLLEGVDTPVRIAGARAAQQVGDTQNAVVLFKRAAEEFDKQGRQVERLDALGEAVRLDAADAGVRIEFIRECLRVGEVERARPFLTAEAAGDDPQLLLALADMEFAAGNEQTAKETLMRVLKLDGGLHHDVTQMALALAQAGRLDSAAASIDIVTDAALVERNWEVAVAALETFVGAVPHIPSLIRLIDVCVDAGLDAPLRDAQARLADAYLAVGQGVEARFISEDLLQYDPGCEAHAQRLRRAHELLGIVGDAAIWHVETTSEMDSPDTSVSNVETVTEAQAPGAASSNVEITSATPAPDAATSNVQTMSAPRVRDAVVSSVETMSAPQVPDVAISHVETRSTPQVRDPLADASTPTSVTFEPIEIDLSEALSSTAAIPGDRVRSEAPLAQLEAATNDPKTGFVAAAALGRVHIIDGNLEAGVRWLERAADSRAPSREEGFAVLYDLADALERLGDRARALAVLLDLDADAGGYRDSRARIDLLARAEMEAGR
jgi:tetratricopeptide (TPR) repeat protein